MKLYHLSKSDLTGKILTPRIPNNRFTRAGEEENKTPRISFSSSIDGSLMGITGDLTGVEFYVHEIDKEYSIPRIRKISNKEVPDQFITDEVWVMNEVKLVAVSKIKVTKSYEKIFKQNRGTMKNLTYDWEFIDKSIVHESSDEYEFINPLEDDLEEDASDMDQAMSKNFTSVNTGSEPINEHVISENKGLVSYLNNTILPLYSAADRGHGPKHITSVAKNARIIADVYSHNNKIQLDASIIMATAYYHDIGLVTLRKHRDYHHEDSYNYVLADKKLTKWFSPDEIQIIANACLYHRASTPKEDRLKMDIYAKIISDADGSSGIGIHAMIERAYYYRIDRGYSPDNPDICSEIFEHLSVKYGPGGTRESYILKESSKLFNPIAKKTIKILGDYELFKIEYENTLAMIREGVLIEQAEDGFVQDGYFNAVKWIEGKPFRDKVEVLVFDKNGYVYLYKKPDGSYEIPGGSKELDVEDHDQVAIECEEEAGLKIKNIRRTGVCYIKPFLGKYIEPFELRGKKYSYQGKHIEVYIADLKSIGTDTKPESDFDKKMRKNGKFYDIDEVYDSLNYWHQSIMDHLELYKKKPIMEMTTVVDDVLEEVVFNPLDIIYTPEKTYNLNKWGIGPGKSNTLFITGLSGGGKTTRANKLCNSPNTELISLDWMDFYDNLKNTQTSKLLGFQMIVSLYETRKDIVEGFSSFNKDIFYKAWNDTINFLLEETAKHPNTRFVIEGIQIFEYCSYIEFKDRPLIIVRTSMTMAMFRRWYRSLKWTVNEKIGLWKWYINGDKKLSNMLNIMDDDDGALQEMNIVPQFTRPTPLEAWETVSIGNKKFVPVYILLTYNSTPLGKRIVKYTKEEYSHCSITIDPELKHVYSFGLKTDGQFGMSIESSKEGYMPKFANSKDPSRYGIYVTFISEEKFIRLKDKLNSMLKDYNKYKYNFLQLFKLLLKMENKNDKKLICTEFVALLLKEADSSLVNGAPSLLKPRQVVDSEKFREISKGYLKDYDPVNTVKVMQSLLRSDELSKLITEHMSILPDELLPLIEMVFDESEDESMNEGVIDLFAPFKVISVLMKDKILRPLASTINKVEVDKSTGEIIVQGINYQDLMMRTRELYQERGLLNMFEKQYMLYDQMLFDKKKITRNKMKVSHFKSHSFFAIELVELFESLYKKYNIPVYGKIANDIYNKTWLSLSKHVDTTPLDTSRLSSIFNPQYKLLPHQEEFIRQYPELLSALNLDGYILSFEQGLGKTLTSIALSTLLNKDIIYIVCPNSLQENWAYEIKEYISRYSDETIYKNEVCVYGNSKFVYNKDTTKYIITNMENISKVYGTIQSNKNTMIIIDESHNFRNLEGKRVAELLELKSRTRCTDVLPMSGTPIKAAPGEIAPMLRLIDPLFTEDVSKIYARCFNLDNALASNIIKARFSKIMYRATKQVLTLPPKLENTVRWKCKNPEKYLLTTVKNQITTRFTEICKANKHLSEKAKPLFVELVRKYSNSDRTEEYLQMVHAVVDGKLFLYQMHELNKVFYLEFVKKHVLPEIFKKDELDRFKKAKLEYVDFNRSCMGKAIGEILPKLRKELFINLYDSNRVLLHDTILTNAKKVIIFSMIRGVVDHIYDDLNDAGIGVVKIVGGTKNRMDEIIKFKESDDIKVLVATSQTLATGVTLTEANIVYFFGSPWRDADFKQASDRAHRIGQTSIVNINNIVLDTEKINLSTRMDEILKWSANMTGVYIDFDEDDDLDSLNETSIVESIDSDEFIYTDTYTRFGILSEGASKQKTKLDKIPLSSEEQEIANNRFGKIECTIYKTSEGKYYATTHRARTDLYDSLESLPKSKVLFVSSTS